MRRLVLLQSLIWLTVSSLAWAQQKPVEHKYQLNVATDRTDALYHVNEPVKFVIVLLDNNRSVREGEIAYVLSNDGLELSRGKVAVTGGRIPLWGQLDQPGFLRCQVSYTVDDGKKISTKAAAAIDPLKIKPTLPVPDDFDEFWAEQKRRLAEVPMNPDLTCVDSNSEDIEVFESGLPGGSAHIRLFRSAGRCQAEDSPGYALGPRSRILYLFSGKCNKRRRTRYAVVGFERTWSR